MSNPWRYRCPEGHASVRLGRDVFYCTACGQQTGRWTYPKGDLRDLKGDDS